MTRRLRRVLAVFAAAMCGAGVAAVACATVWCSRYDASMAKVYDVPVPDVSRSTDPAVLARGKHLLESIGSCAMKVCHGADLGGVEPFDTGGALGVFATPNITSAGIGGEYADGQLVRLIRHGIKKDGHSVRLMPSQAFGWLPDADLVAMVSYLRSVPAVTRPTKALRLGAPLTMLDRAYDLPIDVARRIDHTRVESVPSPEPTAAYGRFIARACRDCHGDHLSGGRIPGMTPSMVTPLNLTPHETGLKDWTFEDFDRTMRTAVRKNGKPLSVFMPVDSWRNLDEVEMHALWAYLIALPPLGFGQR